MSAPAKAKEAARAVESNPAVRVLARCGFIAAGLVHLLIGVIALVIAFGGSGRSDQSGAFEWIAAVPFGVVALWIVAIALWALAVWDIASGIIASRSQESKKWGERLYQWGHAVIHFVLGLIALNIALGAHPNSETGTKHASRGILSLPGGPIILGILGGAIAVAGIVYVVAGAIRDFRKRMTIPNGPVGMAVTALGVVGYIAKGIALVVVGILLIIAAVRVDPNAAGGLDGAILALMRLPYGPFLAGAVGVGFIAYGVFYGIRAKYAKL